MVMREYSIITQWVNLHIIHVLKITLVNYNHHLTLNTTKIQENDYTFESLENNLILFSFPFLKKRRVTNLSMRELMACTSTIFSLEH